MSERMTLQRSNRVGFDLTKRYGHNQIPKAIPNTTMPKAEQMTDAQFDAMYAAIKAELGDEWCTPGSPACLREQEKQSQ